LARERRPNHQRHAVVAKKGSLAYDHEQGAANHLVRELAVEMARSSRQRGWLRQRSSRQHDVSRAIAVIASLTSTKYLQ